MTWIVFGCLAAGAALGAAAVVVWRFLRQGQRPEANTSHADKLDYPADDHEHASIAALARAAIAAAKDNYATQKNNAAQSERAHRVHFWTAIGIGAYTVLTTVILAFGIAQYGDTHRFNKKQRDFFVGQLAVMQGQLDEMRNDGRAWMGIDPAISIDSNLVQSGPSDARMGDIRLSITLLNVGRSPAEDLTIELWPIIRDFHSRYDGDWRPDQDNKCAADFNGVKGGVGDHYFLLPSQTTVRDLNWPFPVDYTDTNAHTTKLDIKGLKEYVVIFYGCITYRTIGEVHQTGVLFTLIGKQDLVHPADDTPLDATVDRIPKINLRVVRVVTAGRVN